MSQIGRARSLRKSMTDCERILWSVLREAKQGGLHFRRQAPIGRYHADFACHRSKLIVELDGSQHSQPEAISYDAERDAFLRSRGYTVVRFANHEGRNDLYRVLDTIVRMAQTSPTRRG
jgi:very-short-patch-repair endonuclease